jgi:hypothetical protein
MNRNRPAARRRDVRGPPARVTLQLRKVFSWLEKYRRCAHRRRLLLASICERISSSRLDGVTMPSSSWAGRRPPMRRSLRSIPPSTRGLAGRCDARGSRSRISSRRLWRRSHTSEFRQRSADGCPWSKQRRIRPCCRQRCACATWPAIHVRRSGGFSKYAWSRVKGPVRVELLRVGRDSASEPR